MGYRLPLSSLPYLVPEDIEPEFERDPFEPRGALDADGKAMVDDYPKPAPREVVRTALCAQLREGRIQDAKTMVGLHWFLDRVDHGTAP